MRYGIQSRIKLCNEVKLIEFDIKMFQGKCNCKLKQQLNLVIYSKPSKMIQKIKDFTDGAYEYELYHCKECEIFWINDTFCIDGLPKGWREPDDSYEFLLITEELEKKK